MIRKTVSGPFLVHNVVKMDADGEQADFWLLISDGMIQQTGTGTNGLGTAGSQPRLTVR